MFSKLFANKKPILAMLHLFRGSFESQLRQALEDLEKLNPLVDGVIVENYGWGYKDSNNAVSRAVEVMKRITAEVVSRSKIPVGVNLLPNDYRQALQIASETGAKFIQLDHVTGEFVGCDSVDPANFKVYREKYSDVLVLGGIHPKYYTLVDSSTKIADSALKAVTLTDAIVVTGEYTGGETNVTDLSLVKSVVGDHPVVIGSGLNQANALGQLTVADGAIVGTALKRWGAYPGVPIDETLTKALMVEVAKLR